MSGWDALLCMCDSGAGFLCVFTSPTVSLQYINQQHLKGAQSWDIRRRLDKPVREDDFVILFFKGVLSMFFEN
jgi:hypothetical protein